MEKLGKISKTNIFKVPDGYFDRLPLLIQKRLESPVSEGLLSKENLAQNIFKTPDGYFDQLTQKIHNKVTAESQEEFTIPDALSQIPKAGVFQVPDRYFDHLALQVQNRLEKQRKKEHVITWGWKPVLKYALPVLVISMDGYFYFSPDEKNWHAQLSEIDTEHLVAYLNESEATENELIEAIHFNEHDLDLLNLQVNSGLFQNDVSEKDIQSELENEL